VSKVRRRSGSAVYSYCYYVNYRPRMIWQAGVGVHHTETSIFKQYWPEVHIRGFDPLMPVDPYPGEFEQVALGESVGHVTFYAKNPHNDGSTMKPPPRESKKYKPMEVWQTRLDNWTPLHRHNLLWLDCEGSELEVLRGAMGIIRSFQVINVEMTGKPDDGAGWNRPEDVHQFLATHGFFHTWTHTTRCRGGQYDAIYVDKDVFDPQFCCNPGEITRWRMATTVI